MESIIIYFIRKQNLYVITLKILKIEKKHVIHSITNKRIYECMEKEIMSEKNSDYMR